MENTVRETVITKLMKTGKETTTMKKIISYITMTTLLLVLSMTMTGCGRSSDTSEGSKAESAYEDALAVLTAVVGAYTGDELFAMYGGDQANAVMDAPGKFDITQAEELEFTLGLPPEQAESVEDAASMVHMMNGNIFTGAAYRLKADTDREAFAEAYKTYTLDRQWICGQPDTLLIVDVDGTYVITAYGEAETMELFKNHALSALTGAQVMVESPIA